MRAIKILTDLQIRQAKQKENQYKLNDGNGLYLLVHPNGSKYWRMKYRFDNKEKTLSFGVWPEVSLKAAREKLSESRTKIQAGFNPIELKREKKLIRLQSKKAQSIIETKKINTFDKVAHEWMSKQGPRWTEEHQTRVRRSLEIHVFPEIGQLPITEIDTITLLNEIKQLQETKLRSTKLVSTTPKLFHEGSDKTDLMFKELFLKAEKSITIVGYVMTNDKHVKEIFEIIKSNPSIKKLDIKFIFDTAEESKEWGAKTPSVKKIIQSNWGDEKPFPKIFTYKDKKSSLHAKVLIIDSKEILITSANMTGRGMQRNLEMGIYHKGQPAKEAENLIQELIHDGYFNRV